MTSFVHKVETTSTIPPARLFKAFVLDPSNHTKFLPNVKSHEIIEGDGGPGSIYQAQIVQGDQVKSYKLRVDVIDEKNFLGQFSTIIEGDDLPKPLDSLIRVTKLEAGSDGGSVVKHTITVGSKLELPQDKLKLAEAIAKKREEMLNGALKGVEAYLLAHPDEYN